MMIAMIEGWHRVCGKAQGYIGLPLRDMRTHDGYPVMISAWTSTPTEFDKSRDVRPCFAVFDGDMQRSAGFYYSKFKMWRDTARRITGNGDL